MACYGYDRCDYLYMKREAMFARTGLLFILSILLVACGDGDDNSRKGAAHPVEVAQVNAAEEGQSSVFTAVLEAWRTVRIIAQEEGRLIELPVYEGDRVKQGQILARLDDSLMRAELNKVVATRRQAQKDLARLQTLKKKQLVSDEQLSRAQTALAVARADEQALHTRIEYMSIRAPFDGVISQRLVEPGDVIARHQHILTLLDDSQLRARLQISELFLPLMKKEDPAQVRIDALGAQQFPAQISRIYPSVDEQTRQGVVEILLQNVPVGALPGQLCRVQIQLPATGRATIPLLAIRHDGAQLYVYRVNVEGKAERVTVRTGVHLGERVEILEGLSLGEQVVTRGFIGLRDGLKVKVVGGGTASP